MALQLSILLIGAKHHPCGESLKTQYQVSYVPVEAKVDPATVKGNQ